MSKEEMNERYMATAKSDGTLDVKWYVENNRLYRRVWKRVKGWTLPVEYTKAEMAHVMTGIENRLVDIVATKGYAPSNETNETTKTRIKTMCENNKNVKKKDEEREKDSNASRYSTFGVITRNKPEASYMIQWCEAKGWPPPTSLGKIAKFPWVACLDFVREDTAWTDRLDRAMEYKTFAEFIEQNAQVDRLSTAGEKDKTMNNDPKRGQAIGSDTLAVRSTSLVVCLCGSTRFRDEFTAANRRETMAGRIVVAPGVFAHSGDPLTEEDKERLDELHFRKIDMASRVLVVNPGGYIGESTRREIAYAETLGKMVLYTHH